MVVFRVVGWTAVQVVPTTLCPELGKLVEVALQEVLVVGVEVVVVLTLSNLPMCRYQ